LEKSSEKLGRREKMGPGKGRSFVNFDGGNEQIGSQNRGRIYSGSHISRH